MKITKTVVDRLGFPVSGQKIYWDSQLKGFGLRATAGGSKAYVVQSRIERKTIRRTIGEHGVYTADQARLEAKKLLLQMEQGADPKAIKVQHKLQAITLAEIFADYKEAKSLREKTIIIYSDVMQRCLPDWQNKAIISLTRDMVEKRLLQIANANGPRGPGKAQAGQCYRLLRSLIRFAQEQYEVNGKPLITIDPTRNLSRGRSWTEQTRRQSVIEKHQLAAWFKAVLALKNETVRDYFILTILTGLRRNEGLTLKWSDVNLPGKYIKIDAASSKNHQEHRLPLSDYLHKMLKRRLSLVDSAELNSIYVFPSSVNPGHHLQEPKRVLKQITESSGVKFMLHDLRRTFITIAESLDVPQYTLKKLLNHSVRNDVTGGYVVTDMERLREPMQKITNYVLEQAGIKKAESTRTAV